MSTLKEKAEQILQEKEEKIIAENIKKDIQIFDVTGNLEEGIDTSDANATENDLVEGTNAYVNGVKIDGTIYDQRNESGFYSFDNIVVDDNTYTEHIEIEAEINLQQGYNSVVFDNDVKMGCGVPYSDLVSAINLDPNIIVQGNTILGVDGTYEGIDTSDATALENDIVEGKTAYTADGLVEGTIRDFRTGMENAGADINSVSEDGTGKLIMQGAMNFEDIVTTDGTPIDIEVQESMIVSAIGLTANKIKKDENVLGVIGTLETTGTDTSDATATASDIVENTSAYVDGVKLDGTLKDSREQSTIPYTGSAYYGTNYGTTSTVIFKLPQNTPDLVVSSENEFIGNINNANFANSIGLTANKIKKDETILGVTGTYEGSGSATTVNTTLNIQIGDRSGSFEHLPYITFENLKSATFDITQLYNWNRNNGNGTPISQTILEMPYVYLKLEISEHYELAGGFEVMYELVALDKPLIYSYNEYDSEAQVAKNCYKASMQSGVFTNTEYNTETSKDELIPGMNYTTFEEFWTAFCSSLYNDSSIKCIKPTRTTTYEAYAMMGYLYSNLV